MPDSPAHSPAVPGPPHRRRGRRPGPRHLVRDRPRAVADAVRHPDGRQARSPAADINAVPGSRAQGWLAQGRSEVLARHGIVATSDPLAAQAGLEILRQGGNAIDAAVATGAVLDVTSQNDTGIGGDLFALVYVAKDKKLYALNSGGWAPAGWTPEFFTEHAGREARPAAAASTPRRCRARSPATTRCSSASAR